MSLHKYIVPPPLALGVSPAPPPKPSSREKEREKEKEKAKELEKQKEKEKLDKERKEDEDKAPEKGDGKVNGDIDAGKKKDVGLPQDHVPEPASPGTPNHPGSMIPEPATPGDDPVNLPSPSPAPVEETALVPGPNGVKAKTDDSKPLDPKNRHESPPKDDEPEPEPEPEPLPSIRLNGPVPHQPLRTRLSLDPSRPYPPIHTDPRGAYHKYAKFMQNEVIFIDVTKDGWLAPQWKEKTEREALARLRGEGELQAEKEREIIKRGRIKRVVPDSAEGVILDLWNDLVVAPINELHIEAFWARYDWSDDKALVHLRPSKTAKIADAEQTEITEKTVGGEQLEANEHIAESDQPDKTAHTGEGNPAEVDDGLEWTRQGMEDILATVGVQCSYDTHKPLPHHYADPPAGAYLILDHSHFLLRLEDYLKWKPQESANQFELLVTSQHDRIFGNMIKAQHMEERKKKELAHREKRKKEKEEEARKLEQGGGEGGKKDKDVEGEKGENRDKGEGKGDNGEEGNKKAEGAGDDEDVKEKKDNGGKPQNLHLKIRHDASPGPDSPGIPTPGSNVQVHNGHVVKPHYTHKPEEIEAPDTPLPEGAILLEGGQVAIAIPVHDDKVGKVDEGQKHEVEVMAAGPKDVADVGEGDKKVGDGEKEKAGKGAVGDVKEENKDKPRAPKPEREHDPLRDAELLAKMIQAQGGGPDGPIGIDDIKLAFKALEMAAGKDGLLPKKEVEKGPLMWTWTERCEMWRWRNYEAGLPDITMGGWEERDWVVFADDRGCEEFEIEQEVIEPEEEDVHDWSC